jgi:N utilization substance protein B
MTIGAKPDRAAPGAKPGASARTPADTPRGAARLAAVQALYQIELSGGSPAQILQEFIEHRLGEAIDGLSLVGADRAFLSELVEGVAAESEALDDMLSAVLAEDWPVERLETLLRVILRAGAYELGYRPEIPARATITQYVNLAQAFFHGKEPGMANGVLDHLAHSLRPEEFEDRDRRPDGPGG